MGNLLDYGDIGLDVIMYITLDFGRMETIIEAARAIQREAAGDPDLIQAFEDVVLTYEKQYYKRTDVIAKLVTDALKDLTDAADEWITSKAREVIKQITGFDVSVGWSDWSFVYSMVNFAVDLGMQLSNGAKYSKTMLQFMSQITVMSASWNAYETAVNRIRQGDHSEAAVAAVRRQFVAYKSSLLVLYDTMVDMASNHLFGIGEDSVLINYLQYEKDQIESVYLTNDVDQFVWAISLEEYKRLH